jgi:hypothetical protein
MRRFNTTNFAVLLFATAMGHLAAKKPQEQTPLTQAGKELQVQYARQLETLKSKLTEPLPEVNQRKKAAFLKARVDEVEATAGIKAARDEMGKINTAKALVGHAKGKWIGGADKGIAAARAKLKEATTSAEREAAEKELAHWQQNRKDGEDALKERQASLDKAECDRPKLEKALKEAEDALAGAKAMTLQTVKELGLKSLLSSDKLDALLAKYVVLIEATPQGLAAFAQQGKEQEELIEKMLSADELLIQMAVADGARGGKYGEAMQIYRDIWKASDKVAEGPLRRLALAISLEHAVPIKQRNAVAKTDAPEFVDPVKRYLHYEKALMNNELDPAFKNLTTWDYRMVVDGEEPDEILSWGREMLRNYRPDHITTSDYRWRYVAAVRSDIPYGSQDNKYDKPELQFFQNILMNGGICGRRAFFGRFILRAFGIPTTARPQRGHAALVHWTPDGWVPCLGAGWGSGWTKTRYDRCDDFLANTQARSAGDPFMMVKRAQWIGDVQDEPRAFGLQSRTAPGFWYGASLYLQKGVIENAKTRTLDAVGQDIAEANETKEKIEITKVTITDKDRKVSIDSKGVITIPAAATTKPTKSSGKLIFMESVLGGKQLHYSRTGGGHQAFEYTIDAPADGKYALTARVATPSWKQSLFVTANDAEQPLEIALPHTVGMWEETKPVTIALAKGKNILKFSREGSVKGISIKGFKLTPTSNRVTGIQKTR